MRIIIQNQNGKYVGELTIEHDHYSSLNYIDLNEMSGLTLIGEKPFDIIFQENADLVYEIEDEPIILKLNRNE
jgi:hypothetical protein